MKKTTSMPLIALLLTTVVPISTYAENYDIVGAGATFPFPLIDLWRVEYNSINPNININYQSIGSGGGVKQHIEKTVNFAASDAPMKQKELDLATDTIHIPETIGGVTVSYNIPEVSSSGLKLTGKQIADIFLGKITKWNDPSIVSNNPGLSLPNKEIITVHRSDGSGTTHVFTEYLTMVSPDWDEKIGFGKSIPWPSGIGAAGNEGVASIIRTTDYSIGYVELAYAFQNDMSYAFIQNADGNAFVEPTLETLAAAASNASPNLPNPNASWESVTINNAPGKDSYPITSFSYVLLHKNLETATKSKDHAEEVVRFVQWMITDGQKFSKDLLYVPIPKNVAELGLKGLTMVTYNGEKIYDGPTTVSGTSGASGEKIPSWLKQVFGFYAEGKISDDELINGLQFLISKGILKVN